MSSFLFVVNYIADLKKDVKFTQTCRLTLGFPTEFRLPIMNHLLGSSLQTSKTVEINQVSFDIIIHEAIECFHDFTDEQSENIP